MEKLETNVLVEVSGRYYEGNFYEDGVATRERLSRFSTYNDGKNFFEDNEDFEPSYSTSIMDLLICFGKITIKKTDPFLNEKSIKI